MNLRDLVYLLAIADHGHFGKAADACFVSQPALSMQIKKLEETLGAQLLERSTKSVMLTALGRLVVEHARDIIYRVNNMKTLVKNAADPLSGDFYLGVIPTLAPYLLPSIIPRLNEALPQLRIFLVELQTDKLLEKLKKGELDGAILALLGDEDDATAPLFREEFKLAVSKKHAFAKRKRLDATDLCGENILLLEEGHCLRQQALSFCQQVAAKEATNFRATSLETLRHMVASGVGVTLMPALACHALSNITYLSVNSPKPMRDIGLIWRSTTAKTALLSQLVTIIKQSMKNQPVVLL